MNEVYQRLFSVLSDNPTVVDDISAIESAVRQGDDLTDTLLSNIPGTDEQQIIELYAKALQIECYNEEQPLLYAFVTDLPIEFLQHHQVIVLESIEDKKLYLVCSKPYDTYPEQAVRLATGQSIKPLLASSSTINGLLEKCIEDSASIEELSSQIIENAVDIDEDVERLRDLASGAPIVRLVDLLILQAVQAGASDIHIEPFDKLLRVRYRIDGLLQDRPSAPLHSAAAIISRIKILAELDIAERRLPQDGRIRLPHKGQSIDIRVSTIPSVFGESVVLRILNKQHIKLSFENLGLTGKNIETLKKSIERPTGIVLVTGPTGSGKTTTLYTALSHVNAIEKKIMTVEDPVEYQLDGIMQMQVNPTIGLGFSDALRALVRQDPDILMIGEMRDKETASIAIQSALTGHLVFSTLHTNDAGSAITRLLDMGVKDYLITTTLHSVIAQRLVRTLCVKCRQASQPSKNDCDAFQLDTYGYAKPLLHQPTGCSDCHFTGYKGRTIIIEQLVLNDEIRAAILAGADGHALQLRASKMGMVTMRSDGIDKALSGITSLQEVIAATQE